MLAGTESEVRGDSYAVAQVGNSLNGLPHRVDIVTALLGILRDFCVSCKIGYRAILPLAVGLPFFLYISYTDPASRVLGWSSLMGVAVVLIIYVLNWPLAKYSIYVRLSDCFASIRHHYVTLDHPKPFTSKGCSHESRQRAVPEYPFP